MKRHPKLIPLSRFHRSILFLALIAKKNAPPVKGYPVEAQQKINYALSFYRSKIKPHFRYEDHHLFQVVRGRDDKLDKLLAEFLRERQELDMYFNKLKGSTFPEIDLNEMGVALEKHIRKEERVVFQKIQEIMSGRDWEEIRIPKDMDKT